VASEEETGGEEAQEVLQAQGGGLAFEIAIGVERQGERRGPAEGLAVTGFLERLVRGESRGLEDVVLERVDLVDSLCVGGYLGRGGESHGKAVGGGLGLEGDDNAAAMSK
jgi:hypothetical protein